MRSTLPLLAGLAPLVALAAGCTSWSGQTTAPTRPAPAGPVALGQPAPDIEGEDVDGTPFQLSDYRGKVVMLDFWGNW